MAETAGGAVTTGDFRRACSRFATGIAVTTVNGPDGKPEGLTVNSFASVSLEPPQVLICVDHKCNILPHFRGSAYFGVSILAEDQQYLSVRFAERSEDRFEGIGWWRGAASGVPLLEGSLAAFECRVAHAIEAGDHTVFIGEVLSVTAEEGNPLLYFGGRYQRL